MSGFHQRKEERREERHQRREERHHHHDEGNNQGYNQGPSQGPYGFQQPPAAYGGNYPQFGGQQGPSQGPYGSQQPPAAYGGNYPQFGGQQPAGQATGYSSTTVVQVPADNKAEAEKLAALQHSQKKKEHLAEFGALASGAFAMYEQHRTKSDPENINRHRIEESVAGVAALGAGGYAVYEHHQVSSEKKEDAAAHPDENKHHHSKK